MYVCIMKSRIIARMSGEMINVSMQNKKKKQFEFTTRVIFYLVSSVDLLR